MSQLALTADLWRTLAQDLSSGVWTPVTLAWFRQLYVRVGQAEAPTNIELATLIPPTLAGDVADLAVTVDTQVTALNQAVAVVLSPEIRYAELAPSQEASAVVSYGMLAPAGIGAGDWLDLAPRVELAFPDVAPGVNTI